MASGSNELHPHLHLVNRAITQKFTAKSGRGPTLKLMTRERESHGRRLLNSLNDISNTVHQLQLERTALDIEAPDGITLEFKSAQGFDLAFESLDLSKSGIELLNVRTSNEITYATCWVPDGKLALLVRRVTAYLNENTKFNKPKHANLIESIESIGLATIEALWTDESPMPQGDGAHWWEVWLRTDNLQPNAAFLRFESTAKSSQIPIAQQWLAFPERVVTNIKATRVQLSQAISLLNLIAEIRNADRQPAVPYDLSIPEQDDLVDDLSKRLDIGNDSVAVAILDTGVARKHPLIEPVLEHDDTHTVDDNWGTVDHHGHGTNMAGIVLYGDIREIAATSGKVELPFRLESVKILPPSPPEEDSDNQEVLGAITAQAVARCEIQAPDRKRVICKAVTSDMHKLGEPSSYSAAIDQLAYDDDLSDKRLFVISAGNVQPDNKWLTYPNSNHDYGVEQPAQAWNALTVGAYTNMFTLPGTPDYAGWATLAKPGDLSPFSATSRSWENSWPLKPEVLFEGGNVAVDSGKAQAETPKSLQLLTTNRKFTVNALTSFSMTSAATAQAAKLSAQILAEYPDAWPETVRGLIVHHSDWTPAQKSRYLTENSQAAKRLLLRTCGYGIPNSQRVLHCMRNRVSLIAQETIQPYRLDGTRGTMNEMCIFQLPWPKETLFAMAEKSVHLRITLSYFIEPSPAKRGWTNRYRYASHGLRFDLRRLNESHEAFNKRVNVAMRDADDEIDAPDDSNWLLGDKLRRHGSIHSDQWSGMAIDLAERDLVAIHPVVGWWRQRVNRGRCETQTRFSLVVSLETEDNTVDLYNEIKKQIEIPMVLELEK